MARCRERCARRGAGRVRGTERPPEPIEYYFKPPDLERATVLVLEPMLATGGSLSWAIGKAKASGASRSTALWGVAAPIGVARIQREHPDVHLVVAGAARHPH